MATGPRQQMDFPIASRAGRHRKIISQLRSADYGSWGKKGGFGTKNVFFGKKIRGVSFGISLFCAVTCQSWEIISPWRPAADGSSGGEGCALCAHVRAYRFRSQGGYMHDLRASQ